MKTARTLLRFVWAAPFLIIAVVAVIAAALALMVGLGPKTAQDMLNEFF